MLACLYYAGEFMPNAEPLCIGLPKILQSNITPSWAKHCCHLLRCTLLTSTGVLLTGLIPGYLTKVTESISEFTLSVTSSPPK